MYFQSHVQKRVWIQLHKILFILEYFGDVVVNVPYESEYENWNIYLLTLKLTNQDFLCKVFEEYLIYDAIGIIGSVGGTLGIII